MLLSVLKGVQVVPWIYSTALIHAPGHSCTPEAMEVIRSKIAKIVGALFFVGSRLTLSARILWLFVESDFFTFAIPNCVFGLCAALSPDHRNGQSMIDQTLRAVPGLLLFNGSNLIIFDIANQRTGPAIAEDKINKPWRPIPAGLMTAESTRRLLLAALALVLGCNAYLGTTWQTLVLFVLTWIYNDLGGGDGVLRNGIIAIAFGFYNHGSLMLALSGAAVTDADMRWVAIVSLVIFTTMHVQDLKDVAGDESRGRMTPPIALGDKLARRIIAVAVMAWGLACVAYWGMQWTFCAQLVLALSVLIFGRVLYMKGKSEDSLTWKLWCCWLALLYSLPALSGIR